MYVRIAFVDPPRYIAGMLALRHTPWPLCALVAAILWSFHLLALRSDNNREKKAQAAGIVAGDASAQGERRVMLTDRIGKLEEELARLRAELERLG